MSRQLSLALLILVQTGVIGPVSAHHSWPASFEVDRQITLEGKVLRFLWRNPHVFIYLEVSNDQGEIEKWEVEMNNTIVLSRLGWNKETIQTGDQVLIEGWPGRNGARRIHMLRFKRPGDGLEIAPAPT